MPHNGLSVTTHMDRHWHIPSDGFDLRREDDYAMTVCFVIPVTVLIYGLSCSMYSERRVTHYLV